MLTQRTYIKGSSSKSHCLSHMRWDDFICSLLFLHLQSPDLVVTSFPLHIWLTSLYSPTPPVFFFQLSKQLFIRRDIPSVGDPKLVNIGKRIDSTWTTNPLKSFPQASDLLLFTYVSEAFKRAPILWDIKTKQIVLDEHSR